MRELLFLVIAAALEVGGDALIRTGLKSSGIMLMIAGAILLIGYGFMVNLTRLDFGRLMGIYIVIFFVASQLFSVFAFGEKLRAPVLVGGSLVIAGGLVMKFWQTA